MMNILKFNSNLLGTIKTPVLSDETQNFLLMVIAIHDDAEEKLLVHTKNVIQKMNIQLKPFNLY